MTGVLGIYYWIEVRMESEEEHTGRQMEANTQSGSLKHYLESNYLYAIIRFVYALCKAKVSYHLPDMMNAEINIFAYFLPVTI